jgi:hypothetical protein
MSKLNRVLLIAAFAVSLPRTSSATNYHEYKKFNLSGPTERVPSRCHANLKEHRLLLLRQVGGISASRLTPHAELI